MPRGATVLLLCVAGACAEHEQMMVEPPPIRPRLTESETIEQELRRRRPPSALEADRRYWAAVVAVSVRVLLIETWHGRRLYVEPSRVRGLALIDLASEVLCSGGWCQNDCVAPLTVDTPTCGTGLGRDPTWISVDVAGCDGPDRTYEYYVESYQPLVLQSKEQTVSGIVRGWLEWNADSGVPGVAL